MRSVPRVVSPRSLRLLKSYAAPLFAAAFLAVPSMAAAAVERTETPIPSTSYQSDVSASMVRLHVPLPAKAAAHPEACDWIQYERFRGVDGPTDPMQADSVAILMPGIMEGASAFDILARNSIREAARRGRKIEVWALDRRSNCLEDRTGVKAFEQSGNFKDAADYYFRKKPIAGKTFQGFDTYNRVLADIGLEQTVKDEYAVMTNELPSQPWRESHVICGGHSLGGPLTQMFAGWDFDGDTKTTEDAGYRQCAAFVGFESMLDLDPTHDSKLLQGLIQGVLGGNGTLRKLARPLITNGTLARRLDLSGADPVSTMVLEAIAYAAHTDPSGSADGILKQVPYTKAIADYFHSSGSADLGRFLFSKDSIRDYSYTNAGLLGQLLDDNGAPFAGIRSSFGFFSGSPLRRNRIADQVSNVPGLSIAIQKSTLMMPFKRAPGRPATGWTNYDQLGSGPLQIGAGLTSPAAEVTDIRDLSRILYEGPINFTDPYFPMRILVDISSFYIGDRGVDLAGFKYSHPIRNKPRMDANGTTGVAAKSGFGSPDPMVFLPGYEHVDSVTAAEKQNNGLPEGSSKMLNDMIDRVVPR